MKNTILLLLLSCQVFAFAQRGNYKPDKPTPSISNGKGTNSQKPAVKPKSEVAADKNTVTLYILPAMAPCPGNPTQQCYQFKKSGSDALQFVDDIEKLPDYEFGYTYTIQAKQKEKEVYIEGQSPYKYIWVKTLSKIEEASNYIDNSSQNNTTSNDIKTVTENGKSVGVSSINTSSAIDGIWYLRKMKEAEGKSIVTDDNVMWIDINTFKDYLSGFGACNKFEATLRSDLNTKFTVSKITPTYYSCGNEIVEKLFFSLLEQTNKFELKNGNLILSNQWNFLLGFTKDKDNKEDIPVTYTPKTIVKNDQQTYATDETIKGNTVSDSPNKIKNSEYNETTSTQINNEPAITTIVQSTESELNKAISEKDKQIADLQKQLDEAKKAKEEEAKKQEELKQQQEAAQKAKVAADKAKSEELKKKQAQAAADKEKADKLKKLEAENLQKQKEIEEMKKQLNDVKKNNKYSISEAKNKNTDSKEVQDNIVNKENQIINKYTKLENTNIENIDDFSDINKENSVFYMYENRYLQLDLSEGIYKNTFFEIDKEESKLQFIKNKLPKFYIKSMTNLLNEEYIYLIKCNFKKGTRQVPTKSTKNQLKIKFKSIRNNIYEIILPYDLDVNEYSFVTKDMIESNSNILIPCFGVAEGDISNMNNQSDNVKEAIINKECKPDDIEVDKITKDKIEYWYCKIARSKEAGIGIYDQNMQYYLQVSKCNNKYYLSLGIYRYGTQAKAEFSTPINAKKGNTFLLGFENHKPLEFVATNVSNKSMTFGSSEDAKVSKAVILESELNPNEITELMKIFNENIVDGIRILLDDDIKLERTIEKKNGLKIQEKLNCFFNSIKS